MILRTDVGSRVILQTEMANENVEPNFKRMYIRYNAQNVDFLGGYRPFVGLDGCHLKGRFGGQLLSATAKDGNDNIFPMAMAVVEQENKDSWTWFLGQFADDIGRPEELNLVFISDRQKVLNAYMFTFIISNAYLLVYLIAGPSTYNGDSIPNCGAQVLCEAYIQQLQG